MAVQPIDLVHAPAVAALGERRLGIVGAGKLAVALGRWRSPPAATWRCRREADQLTRDHRRMGPRLLDARAPDRH